jgi:hypothetical protein
MELMYEWQNKFVGYSKQEAEEQRDSIKYAGGVAYLQRMEGMEMGSGPHFQGYQLIWIEPDILRRHVEFPSMQQVDKDRYGKNARHETDDPCADCGHQYYRHFDWMEDFECHCKYCHCMEFIEKEKGV